MTGLGLVVVGLGAAGGAWLRWWLSVSLNTASAVVPWGTLSANILGAYWVGIALAFLAENPQLSPEWKLFISTGFLGGLTTFSTFSAESFQHLQQGQIGFALLHTAAHVLGAVMATFLGWCSWHFLHKLG